MPKYDAAHYTPPAPVAEVSLRLIGTSKLVEHILLLIDTGADLTLLPRSPVERLGVKPEPGNEYELVAFDGTRSTAPSVQLDMIFSKRAYRGRYLLIDDERGILGRDVLCNCLILLNGPGQEWSEPDANP